MISTYKTIDEFGAELKKIELLKNDFIIPARRIQMHNPDELYISELEKGYALNKVSHGQLAERIGIPRGYYRRIGEIPGLREFNVNTIAKSEEQKRFTIRTLENTARAILSDRYLPVDNIPVLNEISEMLEEIPNDYQIKANALTDEKMYIQIFWPHTEQEIVKGDPVQFGVTITNSEVGLGSFNIEASVWRLVCTNGMIGQSLISRKHLGRRITENDDTSLFRRETIQADVKAVAMKAADILRNSLQDAQLEQFFSPLREAAGQEVRKPEEAIQNITKRYSLNENEGRHILRNMFKENSMTRWGLANGVTNAAFITDSRDRQYDLERIGSEIITMSNKEWEKVAG